MSNLNSFAELMKQAAEDKRLREAAERNRKETQVAPLLSELFATISKGKEARQETLVKEAPLLAELQSALADPEKFKAEKQDKRDKIVELVTELEEKAATIQTKVDVPKSEHSQPVVTDLEKKFLKLFNRLQNDFQTLKKYVESRPQVQPSGGVFGSSGSGEVRILRMDDINISAIQDNRMLVWDTDQKKFRFIDVPVASNLGRPTLLVTTDYAPNGDDFYIGVHSENIVTITLPDAVVNGKEYIIKDESGHAQSTPIKLVGTIDGDVNGVELRVNNGSISLIYRNGWRII